MSFIESLGGYQNARERCKRENVLTDEDFEYGQDQLLRYRRENNIFETGDKIIFSAVCNSVMHYSACLEMFISQGLIQHATSSEIKAGHRL